MFVKLKQTHRYREQTCGCQGGGGLRGGKSGNLGEQRQKIIYRMNKQGSTV